MKEPRSFEAWQPVFDRRQLLKAGAGLMLLGLMPTFSQKASAQDMSNGANNFYTSEKVMSRKVTFLNQYQMKVAGNLFLPKEHAAGKLPAIVVGHPMGAVKEQSANLYATKMAEQGFAALSIDLPFWGESEGKARQVVSPDLYAEAFSAAEQRYVEFTGGKIEYTSGTVHEVDENTHPIQCEFYELYRTPRGEFTPEGSSPALTTHPTLTSNIKFMNFYPFNDIETISPRPMLFITGGQAHSKEFSEDAYRRAAEPKELLWVKGAGHVDLYDRTDLIPFDKLTEFFRSSLK